MSDSDISNILIDFCSLFDGTIRLRFFGPSSTVTYDYDSSTCSHWDLPVVHCERIDTFVPSYKSLCPHLLPDNLFYVDLPTIFGYRSSRGMWLTTGTHHTRITFDADVLFAY